MASHRSAKSVFVGNIPYEATEQQLMEVFEEVGRVVGFRLVYDKETGKPQGYGFCEFMDAETALCAMRNLNNREFHGRNLRVDFAEKEKQQNAALQKAKAAAPRPAPISNMTSAPNTAQTVNTVVESMSSFGVYNLVAQMKMLVQQNPDQARSILNEKPQLAYALLRSQAILGMINAQTVQKLVTPVAQQPPMNMTSNPPIIPGVNPMNPTPHMPVPPGNMNMMMGGMPNPGYPPAGPVLYNGGNTSYPPQPHNFTPAPFNAPPLIDQQQQQLIQTVMAMSQEQIDALPLEQRTAVQAIKQHLAGNRFQ
ncbi:cleavage stimulation factor, 3' pre-RNA, subunit 2, 64kDa [Planoprotostelium fungivorum]|uniref:Cleavage stimulation factor, 3' pre-RNA, subunit 2, 64kDa n=1 Tax=Planoprotostelium fungivorum TaxID=1890364 RepID=A0A2P6NL49_9EUKA|nr:cleavage stimulation factor, 3' pre-RNA, subunit 2, 64kDa [Planoprotostelium fungivorum]